MTMKVKNDPDGDIIAKVYGLLLAGFLASTLWFVFRVSDGNLIMIIGGGFIVIAVHGFPRWKDKIKVTMLMSFFSGLIQFFMAMLMDDRFLLIGFIFASTFLLLYYWPNRVAASITLAIASIGIAQKTGFQPGMTRFINQMLTGICVLVALAIIEYLMTTWRIRLILQQYTLALHEQLSQISSPDATSEKLKIRVLTYAGKANQLLAGQRFMSSHHNSMVRKAQIPLEHLHVISRALILLENATPPERELHADAIRQLESSLLSMAEQLKNGEFLSGVALENGSVPSTRTERAVAIINSELSAMGGKAPEKAV